jgi:hypothetical protein
MEFDEREAGCFAGEACGGVNLRAGMAPNELQLKLGADEAACDEHHAEQSLPHMESPILEFGFAAGMLRKSPGFASSLFVRT